MKKLLIAVVAVLVLALAGIFVFVPGYIERSLNRILTHEPYVISLQAREQHNQLTIVDLHSDTLLWNRDLLTRGRRGHVDIPRLREGNVAIQVFPAVTKSPAGQNYDRNTGDSDQITPLVMAQAWPLRTWGNLFARAAYQADRLARAEARAPDQLTIIRTRTDMETVLAQRAEGSQITGALLATEGSHALNGELANVKNLYDRGYRMMGLHHFFDNRLGGSLHGLSRAGLTGFGRDVVRETERLRIILDVAHSSEAVVEEVLAMTDRPVIVSHTGMKGACNSPRNISDALMQRIAAQGGLIGIGYWDGAVCDPSPAGVVKSIRYAIDLVGVDHVALGSDYDGATAVTFDTSGLAVLTQEMQRTGFTPDEIRKVMGENAVRFFAEWLPEE